MKCDDKTPRGIWLIYEQEKQKIIELRRQGVKVDYEKRIKEITDRLNV